MRPALVIALSLLLLGGITDRAMRPATRISGCDQMSPGHVVVDPARETGKGIEVLRSLRTGEGIVWFRLQATTGEQLGQHPTEPATVYLTAETGGCGDLSVGAQRLITLPLTMRVGEVERFIELDRIVPAGDWVVLWSYVIIPGAAQHSGRLDAVNVRTKKTRFLTHAFLAGGHFFEWRAEPGRVIWTKRRFTSTDIEVIESVAITLDTGGRRPVAPIPLPSRQ